MGVPQWASYQSERNFRNPDQFVPERWLDDPEYAHDVRDILQPFSVGPRNCLGKKYVILLPGSASLIALQFYHRLAQVLCYIDDQSKSLTSNSLAYAEMRLILARLLWNFDLELMPESRNWKDQKIYTLWEKGALNVKLTPVARH